MEDVEQLMKDAIAAATKGDLEALWVAQLLISHIRSRVARRSCIA